MSSSPYLTLVLPLFLGILPAAADVAQPALYVSPDGNDSNPGTFAAPLATIHAAAAAATSGTTVHIRGGVYRETVTPIRSGTPGEPIVFKPYEANGVPETVVISAFEPVIENTGGTGSWIQHSPSIWKIQLPAGTGQGLGNNVTLVNHQPRGQARWPNAPGPFNCDHRIMARNDSATIDYSTSHTLPPYAGTFRAATYTDADFPASFEGQLSGAYISVNPAGGAHQYSGVVTSTAGNTVHFLFAPNPGGSPGPNEPYYLWNALALLDSPDEVYHDNTTGELYIWHPLPSPPTLDLIETKQRGLSLDIGSVSHLRFEGLVLEGGAIKCRSQSDSITFDRITLRYAGSGINRLAGTTPCVNLGGDNMVLSNSEIRFSWGAGVVCAASNQRIENNVILECADFGLGTWGGHAIDVIRNTVGASARMNIGMYSTASNYLHNHCYLAGLGSSDEGAMNSNFNGDGQNCEVAYNWVHHNVGRRDVVNGAGGGKGIRLDSAGGGVSNYLIHHNLVWNISSGKGLTLWSLDVGMENYGDSKIRAYHNTVIGDLVFQTNSRTRSIAGHDVRNNIVQGISTYEDLGRESATVSNNLVFGVSNLNWPGNVFGTASFRDVTVPDYRIQAGSAAVDLGSTIPALPGSFNGAAPDAGAFEYDPAGRLWTAGAILLPEDHDVLTYAVVTHEDGSRSILVHDIPDGRVLPDEFQVRLGGETFSAARYSYDVTTHRAEAAFALPTEHPEGFQVLEASFNNGATFQNIRSLVVPLPGVNFDSVPRLKSRTAGGEEIVIPFSGTLSKRKLVPIDIPNTAPGDLSSRPVPVVVDTAAYIASGDLQADGSNLRFRTSDGSNTLRHFIESGLNTPSTLVWIRNSSDGSTGGRQIYMAFEEPGTPDASDRNVLLDSYPVLEDPSFSLWLSANSIATSSADYTLPHGEIPDGSPKQNPILQSNPAFQPVLDFGAPGQLGCLKFDGINDSLFAGTITNIIPERASFIIVWRTPPDADIHGRIISAGPPSGESFAIHADGTQSQWTMLESRRVCTSLQNSTIGRKAVGNGRYFEGDLAELLVFDTHLDTGIWGTLKEYVSSKYSMAGEARGSVRAEDTILPVQLLIDGEPRSDFEIINGTVRFTSAPLPPGTALPRNFSITLVSGTQSYALPNGIYYYEPGYDTWASALPAGGTHPLLDLESDGLPNLFEYQFALDPLAVDQRGWWIDTFIAGNGLPSPALFLRRNALANDVIVTIHTCDVDTDPESWSSSTLADLNPVTINADIDGDGSMTALYRIPLPYLSPSRGWARVSLDLISP